MLRATFDISGEVIGTLTATRRHEPRDGPNNSYDVAWQQGASPYGVRRAAAVTGFDRSRRALALVGEAAKALGLLDAAPGEKD